MAPELKRVTQPASKQARQTPAELDEVTLRRAQNGDRAASEQLVVTYQRAVFALISRLLPSNHAEAVEDLAQETFLHVFRALQTFSSLGPAKLSTWILTIATRRAIDWLRKARPATEPFDDSASLATSCAAIDAARSQHIRQALTTAVAEMPPEYRAAFLLREYHGLDYAEIARALNVELGTVKSRLSRARAAIRLELGEQPS